MPIRTGAAGCRCRSKSCSPGRRWRGLPRSSRKRAVRLGRREADPMSEAGTEAVADPRAPTGCSSIRGSPSATPTALVPYLARLGISHLYASPMMRGAARLDARLRHRRPQPAQSRNRQRGGVPRRWSRRCAAHGMGLIVDIVPNHMGVGGADNAWWLDVLEWGEELALCGVFRHQLGRRSATI